MYSGSLIRVTEGPEVQIQAASYYPIQDFVQALLDQEHSQTTSKGSQADSVSRGASGDGHGGGGHGHGAVTAAVTATAAAGHGAVGTGGRRRGSGIAVGVAHGVVGGDGAGGGGTDALQLGALGGYGDGGGGAAVAEEAVEGGADGRHVGVGHAERRRRQPDLPDEVLRLRLVEPHELVHLEHGRPRRVRREARHALLRAAQQRAEELVQVVQEEAVGHASVFG